MATSYNSETQYTRLVGGFRGIDMTSPDTEVETYRFAYAKNVYRDYGSGAGTAIETVPGYRCILPPPAADAEIYGIWSTTLGGARHVLVHRGTELLKFLHSDRDNLTADKITVIPGLAAHRSSGFVFAGSFYLLDGAHYYKLTDDTLTDMLGEAYLPVTYVNGEMYEQRNMLIDKTVNRDTQPTEAKYEAFYRLSDTSSGLNRLLHGFRDGYSGSVVVVPDKINNVSINPNTAKFDGNADIKKAVLISGGGGSFADCTALEEIYICASGGGGTFTGCTALKTVKIAAGVTSIRNVDAAVDVVYLGDGEHLGSDTPTFTGSLRKNITAYSALSASEINSSWGASWASALAEMYHVGHVTLDGESKATNLEPGSQTVATAPPDGYVFPDTSAEGEYVDYSGHEYTVVVGGVQCPLSYAGGAQLYTPDTTVSADVYVDGLRLYDNSEYGDASGVTINVVKIGNEYYEATNGSFTPDTTISVISETPTPEIFDVDPDTQKKDQTFREVVCYDPAESVDSVNIDGDPAEYWGVIWHTIDGKRYVDRVIMSDNPNISGKDTDVTLNCWPSEFKSSAAVGGNQPFLSGNPDYNGTAQDAICKCTLAAAFDGRMFLTGNPALPNTIFWCSRDLNAAANPAYFGQLNYVNDGAGTNPVVALLSMASMLMVLKGDDRDEPTIYYHSGVDTGNNVIPRIYPSEAGVAGVGCTGAAINFFDDATFVSGRGIEAVGKQQVNLERTLAHRSSYVDGVLTHEALERAVTAIWQGYLALFTPSGNVYLADSRQASEDSTGAVGYEFYRLEGVGHYRGQTQDYMQTTGDFVMYNGTAQTWFSAAECYAQYDGGRIPVRMGSGERYFGATEVYTTYLYPAQTGVDVYYADSTHSEPIRAFIAFADGEAVLVEPAQKYSGGTFYPVTAAASVENVLYFGAADGAVLVCNDDKRGQSYGGDWPGENNIHSHWYTFDGRTIDSAVVTSYDTAGYPGIAKKTVKKSFVMYSKNIGNSRITVKVRTNRSSTWKNVGDISSAEYRPGVTDFANAALQLSEEHIGTVKEKEKKWAVKQLLLESGGRHMCPIGIYHFSYRFTLKGRIKA